MIQKAKNISHASIKIKTDETTDHLSGKQKTVIVTYRSIKLKKFRYKLRGAEIFLLMQYRARE